MEKQTNTKLTKNRRRVFLINPKFQLNYIKHTFFVMTAVILTFYASNLYHFWDFKNRGLSAGLPADHIFFDFLHTQQSNLEMVYLITALVAAIFMLAYGIFLSHRVVGPLYRMNEYLKEFRGKKPTRELKFRKGDYFPELAEHLNEFVKELDKS